MTPKVPRRPARPLPVLAPDDVVAWTAPLVRVARTSGVHLTPWNGLRTFGPVGGMRWEPHPPGPAADHPSRGVGYHAQDLTTAVAEMFQTSRRIDPSTSGPVAHLWTPTRPLDLLDVTHTWPLRAGASAALTAAPRPTCCAWARAIRDEYPHLDGLRTSSTLTGGGVVALFSPARDAFPTRPDATLALDSDEALTVLTAVAARIGYRLG